MADPHFHLTLDECERATDWMQCAWPASKLDRQVNCRLCDARETARSRNRERLAVPPSVDLEMPLSVFGLSPRERSLLDRVPIRTLGDLLRHTDRELLAMPEFTPQELASIQTELQRHGLRLGMLADDPMVALSVDEAMVVLDWFRQVRTHWRDEDDNRLAGRIAAWLGAAIDAADMASEHGDDDLDDTVSFDADEIELHDLTGEPDLDMDVTAPDADIDATDIELELDLSLADDDDALDGSDGSDGSQPTDADLDADEAIDAEPVDETGDGGGSDGDGENPDVLPPEEQWKSSNDWKPDDPDAWKGPGAEDDSEGWKQSDDDDSASD